MSLIKCQKCKNEISENAKYCPYCGSKIKRTSIFTKIVIVIFIFLLISMYLGYREMKKVKTINAAVEQKSLEEKARAIDTAIEQKSLEEKAKTIKSEIEQNLFKWNYSEIDDKMSQGKIKSAFVKSLNQVKFDFPYSGSQRGMLELRIHPRYGKDVLFSIERGQFICHIDECKVKVRFGNGKPVTFSASEPADNSTTVLFINNYERFITNMKKVDKVYIEALFFQEGDRVFEFDVSGFKWP